MAKKRFGIATLTGFMLDMAHGPLREAATGRAFQSLTPRARSPLYRVWQLLIHFFMTKQRSLRRIQLSRFRSTLGVSISL